ASRPGGTEFAALSYAEQRINDASRIFDPVLNPGLGEDEIAGWWNGQQTSQGGTFLNLGLWVSLEEAQGIAESLAGYGKVSYEKAEDGQVALALTTTSEATLNDALRAAWGAGATDAFIVRN